MEDQQLVETVTEAIRAHYDGKIAELEEEREEKIAHAVAMLGNGKPASRPARARTVARKEGRDDRPAGKCARGGGHSGTFRQVQEYALSFDREFSSTEIFQKFPEMGSGTRSQALRNLVKRGELQCVKEGRGRHHPAIFAPLPFSSLRQDESTRNA